MKLTSNALMLEGILQLRIRDARTKRILHEYNWRNVITDNALLQFVHLLAGDEQADRAITQIQFGSGTQAADPSDTGLQVPLTPIKDISAITYPTARSVTFTAFLESTELNGFPISEAGLRFANGTFATRRVFAAQNKSEDVTFEFNWTLGFQAS